MPNASQITMPEAGAFQSKVPDMEDRHNESTRHRSDYPDRCPVIVEREINKEHHDPPLIEQTVWLVPQDISVGMFCCFEF